MRRKIQFIETLKSPRFWLLSWGAAGLFGIVYILAAASLSGGEARAPSALAYDPSLLTGEMADFAYTYPPRRGPDASFDHNGEPLKLKDFRGKAILVNFWATWCAPCIKELPSLDALQRKLGGRSFEVVAIAADPKGPEAAQAYLDRLDIENLALYADPQLSFAMSVGGAEVLPLSILYDADGVEIGRLVGEADWSSVEALRLVASAIQ